MLSNLVTGRNFKLFLPTSGPGVIFVSKTFDCVCVLVGGMGGVDDKLT